ncbi:MAG: substrate-binding domain-containing protein [Gammaproteobacteria bacterium]|nr:substrate-binding domain-containing protein [Gammaproteobacteria bacterium]
MNLKELSQILGISQTTVSRALNGYPEVSEKTRALVNAAATQYNYQPNTKARGLATGKSKMIGYVLPKASQNEMPNPVFGDFIAGAAQTYGKQGYDTTITLTENDKQAETYRNLHAKRSVDGVIMQAPKENDERISILKKLGLPFVVHGRSTGSNDYHFVDVNNTHAFARATNFLLDLGHRRVALINGDENLDFAIRRRHGYLQALEDRGLEIDTGIMFSSEMTEEFGYRTMTKLLTMQSRPTAAVLSSYIMAIGARRALGENGLRIGKDFSIVIHDDALSYLPNGSTHPVFTATRSSVGEAGRLCAEILLDIIQNPEQKPRQIILEAELVVGSSTGPAPKHD